LLLASVALIYSNMDIENMENENLVLCIVTYDIDGGDKEKRKHIRDELRWFISNELNSTRICESSYLVLHTGGARVLRDDILQSMGNYMLLKKEKWNFRATNTKDAGDVLYVAEINKDQQYHEPLKLF